MKIGVSRELYSFLKVEGLSTKSHADLRGRVWQNGRISRGDYDAVQDVRVIQSSLAPDYHENISTSCCVLPPGFLEQSSDTRLIRIITTVYFGFLDGRQFARAACFECG